MSESHPTGDWTSPAKYTSAHEPVLPGYDILEELGRGGMGVVYKARQVGSLQVVALKMIRDGALAGPHERGRFRIEAEAAARMRHPNIVQIFEVGEHEGRPYFTMELVEGGNLGQHLAAVPQPPLDAAALICTVALAIQHAHDQKIIHRDLKPTNILLKKPNLIDPTSAVAYPNSEGATIRAERSTALSSPHRFFASEFRPKITDFGLAKRLDCDSTAFTIDGAVIGTASYMAPEQIAGRISELGPAVDVYALGVVLYELLAGRPPFQADSWSETIRLALQEEPEPLTRLRPDVPRDLESICLKCLEKPLNQRYASALELAADLRRFLAGQSVAAVPLTKRERLDRSARRDGYEVIDEIGRGPRSIVYQALHVTLQQPVAVKVFRSGSCTREEWETRLRQYAQQRSALAHPQIVPIVGTGYLDGAPYVAHEFVPHGSLATMLVESAFSVRQALSLVEQVAEIVGYIHRQGVVHGNLKPSNVMLAADGIPRIIDFRLTGGLFVSTLRDDEAPTGVGYLAPELVRDPSAELNIHTDIYGLGTILYELLARRPLFAESTAPKAPEQICSHDPVPPSRLNPDVTPDLDVVCLKCLRKNPFRRYHRAYDLAKRLRHFLHNADARAAAGKPWPVRRGT